MSPLEHMAKARHDRLGKRKVAAWEKTAPGYRAEMMREAAADLLALAEVRPSSNLIAAGMSADAEAKTRRAGLARAFAAMLQAIAEQGLTPPPAAPDRSPPKRRTYPD